MKALLPLFAMVLLLARPARSEQFPGAEWQRVDPAAAGWSSAKLDEAREIAETMGATGVMVVHKGFVVAEWGDLVVKTYLHSVRKSLLSALIGIAVEEKKIDLADTMAKLGIDDNVPSLTEVEKQAWRDAYKDAPEKMIKKMEGRGFGYARPAYAELMKIRAATAQ